MRCWFECNAPLCSRHKGQLCAVCNRALSSRDLFGAELPESGDRGTAVPDTPVPFCAVAMMPFGCTRLLMEVTRIDGDAIAQCLARPRQVGPVPAEDCALRLVVHEEAVIGVVPSASGVNVCIDAGGIVVFRKCNFGGFAWTGGVGGVPGSTAQLVRWEIPPWSEVPASLPVWKVLHYVAEPRAVKKGKSSAATEHHGRCACGQASFDVWPTLVPLPAQLVPAVTPSRRPAPASVIPMHAVSADNQTADAVVLEKSEHLLIDDLGACIPVPGAMNWHQEVKFSVLGGERPWNLVVRMPVRVATDPPDAMDHKVGGRLMGLGALGRASTASGPKNFYRILVHTVQGDFFWKIVQGIGQVRSFGGPPLPTDSILKLERWAQGSMSTAKRGSSPRVRSPLSTGDSHEDPEWVPLAQRKVAKQQGKSGEGPPTAGTRREDKRPTPPEAVTPPRTRASAGSARGIKEAEVRGPTSKEPDIPRKRRRLSTKASVVEGVHVAPLPVSMGQHVDLVAIRHCMKQALEEHFGQHPSEAGEAKALKAEAQRLQAALRRSQDDLKSAHVRERGLTKSLAERQAQVDALEVELKRVEKENARLRRMLADSRRQEAVARTQHGRMFDMMVSSGRITLSQFEERFGGPPAHAESEEEGEEDDEDDVDV